MRSLILLPAAVLLAAACGDNIEPGTQPDAEVEPVPDAEVVPPDALFCAPREAGEIGGPCAVNADCESAVGAGDGYCYVGVLGNSTFQADGFCTREDQTTLIYCDTDADCGARSTCVNNRVDNADYKFCLPACDCEGNACPANQACLDSFNGGGLDKAACVPGNADAEDGDACDGFYECNEDSNCRNDNLEFPGGMCAGFGCTVGDDSTCEGGGHCVDGGPIEPPFNTTMCVDTCTSDAQCRQAEGYECFDPDGAGTATGFCRHPHVGDPCTVDTDCGSASVWTCQTGAGFTGGYCTVTGCATPGNNGDCSPGSICHDPLVGDNYCADRCTALGVQSNCRTGYLCVDTDPGAATVLGCAPTP